MSKEKLNDAALEEMIGLAAVKLVSALWDSTCSVNLPGRKVQWLEANISTDITRFLNRVGSSIAARKQSADEAKVIETAADRIFQISLDLNKQSAADQ